MSAAHQQTTSEKYLAELSKRSFLSLWSFPHLYTDEGKKTAQGTGRELCDLLVVFGSHVLIFSDKHCAYKDTGQVIVDWPRWYRKAVLASIKQLYGAESWLSRYPREGVSRTRMLDAAADCFTRHGRATSS
jgi:hypothetical protein